ACHSSGTGTPTRTNHTTGATGCLVPGSRNAVADPKRRGGYMRAQTILTLLLLACGGHELGCGSSPDPDAASTADSQITAFIGKIRAVDNHSHANSVAPGDSDQDALPLEVILPFEVPVQLRPDNPDWLAAYRALYKYPHADMCDAHMGDLRGAIRGIAKEQ